MQTKIGASTPSPAIAATLAKAAELNSRAILCGNRAGIVEWANASWTKITGFPISETISKPITHFLEAAAIDLELVDFVGQNFLEGRPSTIVFPFESFDGRTISVHLEVQPIRGDRDEVEEFVAIASEITEQQDRSPGPSDTKFEASRPFEVARRGNSAKPTHADAIALRHEVELAYESAARRAQLRTHFDLEIDPHTPSVVANPVLLSEAIRSMLDAALVDIDSSWGFVSVLCGETEVGRSFVSKVHPLPLRVPEFARRSFAFVEVHDTHTTLTPNELLAIVSGCPTVDEKCRALVRAKALATSLGGEMHIDSTPGCGTQSVLLVPI